jgi:ABC-type polysaccharide/polyol phosphate export permease
VIDLLRSLRRHWPLLRDFVRRDLKARYVGSSMGFFWSLVFPVISLCVYMFVFRTILKVRWEPTPDMLAQGFKEQSPAQTALTMLAGISVWTAFSETVSRSTNCLVENANLIQKVVFPSEILPPYLCVSALVNMCIGLAIVLLGGVFLDNDPAVGWAFAFQPERLSFALLLLPLLMFLQCLFTVGLGYLLATLNLYLRDTFHVIGVATMVWMFATPIFYPDFIVVQKGYGWILELNPMYWLIEAYRDIVVEGHGPDWVSLARFLAVGVLAFALGSTFYWSQRRKLPDLL